MNYLAQNGKEKVRPTRGGFLAAGVSLLEAEYTSDIHTLTIS